MVYHLHPILLLSLLFPSLCTWNCDAAVRPLAEATRFHSELKYEYDFSSEATVFDNVTISLGAKVTVQLLSEQDGGQNMHLSLGPVVQEWSSNSGSVIDSSAYGDTSGWFAFHRDNTGVVTTVTYTSMEGMSSLALKKTIASLFSLGHKGEQVEKKTFDGKLKLVYSFDDMSHGQARASTMELVCGEDGDILSIHTTETLSTQQGLLNESVSSETTLLLVNQLPSSDLLIPPSTKLITSSPSVTEEVPHSQPLSEVESDVSQLLSCASGQTLCHHKLSKLIKGLSVEDISKLLDDLAQQNADQGSAKMLAMVDAVFHSGHPQALLVLVQHILKAEERGLSESLVKRLLHHMSIGLPPSKDAVLAVIDLAIANDTEMAVRHQAFLTLGAMAHRMRQEDPALSESVVDLLHALLNHHTGNESKASLLYKEHTLPYLPYSLHTHSVLLDSLGNAGSESSLNTLHTHAQGHGTGHMTPGSWLSTQHAALRSLRSYSDDKTASILEDIAQTSCHSTLQHAAVNLYAKHPKAKRDLSNILETDSLSVSRAKRQTLLSSTDPYSYAATMPAVGWNLNFGDNNFTVDLERTTYNTFELQTDPFSSQFSFSMHDEASFTANLLLASGKDSIDFVKTELCMDGKANYDVNIAKDYSLMELTHQHARFVSATPKLMDEFESAYDEFLSSHDSYATLKADFEVALSSTESHFFEVSSLLNSFQAAIEGSDISDEFFERAYDISSAINNTYLLAYTSFLASKMGVNAAVNSVAPGKIQSALMYESQPFTTHSFFLPYLTFAPQKALSNIYKTYWRTEQAFDNLRSEIGNVLDLTTAYGSNEVWTNPYLAVWNEEGEIDDLLRDVDEEIEIAIEQDSAEVEEIQSFRDSIANILRPSLTTLFGVANPVLDEAVILNDALKKTENAFISFTKAYQSARSTVDTIFGQRFFPGFPNKLRSCAPDYGCGNYPTTTNDQYRNGTDLVINDAVTEVVAPFSGYIKLFNTSSLNDSTTFMYNSTNTIVVLPTEFSLKDIYFVISNIIPLNSVTHEEAFFQAGEVIATYSNSFQIAGEKFVHVESYKVLDGVEYSLDSSKFTSPVLDPHVTMDWNCNEVVTMVDGVVVDNTQVSPLVAEKQDVGNPLVTIPIPGHEFPQPYDLVLENFASVKPAEKVEFFERSTFLMVGPIPVTFSFTASGEYATNISIHSGLLSRKSRLQITPHVRGTVEGSMKVGEAVYAKVEIQGDLMDATLPMTLVEDFSNWPLVASSSMDLQLSPSVLNLTSKLIQVTGVGEFAGEDVLDSQLLWHYSIPQVDRNEFYYEGLTPDETLPSIVSLPYNEGDDCYVRQLRGLFPKAPAFELEFKIEEPECQATISYQVGSYELGDDIISPTELEGFRVVIPHDLIPASRVFVTLTASDCNGIEEVVATCTIPVYDRSPPLAVVTPISPITSNPSKFVALVSLFDEYGLEDEQAVAVGMVAGEKGDDLVPWKSLSLSEITTTPSGSGLDLYSFPQEGRLVGLVLTTFTDVATETECADLCTATETCKSFDYSQKQKGGFCILHDGIVGPQGHYEDTDCPNNFETLPLKLSTDFVYYEKLGNGNSTLVTFDALNLQHRQEFYVNLRLRNKLGYISYHSSPAVLVDLSPPHPGRIRNAASDVLENEACDFNVLQQCVGETTDVPNHRVIIDGPQSATVFNGPIPLLDALYLETKNFIAANWDGFEDSESGLLAYTWCISSSSDYGCDVLPQTDPHSGLSNDQFWTNTGLAKFSSISDGEYYITVNAINRAGYGGSMVTTVHHSTPYLVDTQPPKISDWRTISYNKTTNLLTIYFNVSDGGSGVSDVSVALGLTPHDTGLLDWVTVATSGASGAVSTLAHVPDGVSAWVKLRVTDQVGFTTVETDESPVRVDRSPPTTGVVRDGPSHGIDLTFQANSGNLCMNFDGFTDPHSGVDQYQWLVSTDTSTGYISVLNLTDIEVSARMACTNITLTHGTTYYSTVTATNMADLTTSNTSNGVMVDTTPPVNGVVMDGSIDGEDIDYSSSLTRVAATWNGFVDMESGISHYVISVYRLPFGSGVPLLVHSESVGTETNYAGNHFSFSSRDVVHVRIVAFNGAQLQTEALSDGYTIDFTSPQVSQLVDGPDFLSDLKYQTSTTELSVTWTALDEESGILKVEGAVFELSEGIKTRIYPDATFLDITTVELTSAESSWTFTDLNLISGRTYVTSLTLTNAAGLKATYSTDGVLIDTGNPVVDYVTVFGDGYLDDMEEIVMIANPTQIEGKWLGTDGESGISEYLLAVVDSDTKNIVSNGGTLLSFAKATGGVLSGLYLTTGDPVTGPFYQLAVQVRDNVGLTATAYSETFWISVGDHAGVVYDGFYPGKVDVDYTDEVAAISAHFDGFLGNQCGGIAQYQWAIGSDEEENRGSLMPYTETGIVVVGNGSGYAQVLLPDLTSYEAQPLFVSFRGITGCGKILESTSNGIIIDSTPPNMEILATGSQAVENAESSSQHHKYQTGDTFSSLWEVQDMESGLPSNVTVRLGTYPGGSDVLNDFQTASQFFRGNISAEEGVSTYLTLIAENEAGIRSEVHSRPVVMDTTAPTTGELTCSPFLPTTNSDNPPSSILSQLKCWWRFVADFESTVSNYEVSIATDPLDQSSLLSEILPGTSSEFVSPVMEFEANVAYYVTLYINNGAGLQSIMTSRGIYYITMASKWSGILTVVPNYATSEYSPIDMEIESEAICLQDTDVITILIPSPGEADDMNYRYELGAGYVPGFDDIVPFHSISPNLSSIDDEEEGMLLYTLEKLPLMVSSNRHPFFLTVVRYDSTNLYSQLTSSPIYMKSSDNIVTSWLYDGDDLEVDVDYQQSTTYISGHAMFGVYCPMATVEWGLESVDGMLVQNFSSLQTHPIQDTLNNSYFIHSDQVILYDDETYRIILRGVDLTGEVHIVKSNGTAVTTGGLAPGIVQDGPIPYLDLNYQESVSTLSAHWSGFGDLSPKQEIVYYEIAVGTDKQYPSTRTNILPFTNVGLATSYTVTDLQLIPVTQQYYVTVRAHTVSKATTEATSNGIIAGYIHTIDPGIVMIAPYQAETTMLKAHWTDFTSDVPIISYEWAIGERNLTTSDHQVLCGDITNDYSSFFAISGFKLVDLDTTIDVEGLSLQHGRSYFVTVRAIDQAKKCIVTTSHNDLLVDTTGPLPQGVTIGPLESRINVVKEGEYVAYVKNGHEVTVTWNPFTDPESPIDYYEVGLFELLDCEDYHGFMHGEPVVDFLVVDLQTSFTFDKINLEDNVTYVSLLKATNLADVSSFVYSQPVSVDSSGLSPGVVKDGENWESDLTFQSDITQVSATFSHAIFQPTYAGELSPTACPVGQYYKLDVPHPSWSIVIPSSLDGLFAMAIEYDEDKVTFGSAGATITSIRDQENLQVITGVYQTFVRGLVGEKTVTLKIRAAMGDEDIQTAAVTSVVFIESPSDSGLLVDYEPNNPFEVDTFKTFGIQIHHESLEKQQRIVAWAKDNTSLAEVNVIEQNTTLNLDIPHAFKFEFKNEQLGLTFVRRVDLYVDDIIQLSLHGIPQFSDDTRMALHVFTENGFFPPCPSPPDCPKVEAVFSDVTLPMSVSGICNHGNPFHSWESPIVEFRAAIGTRPGLSDVKDFEVISYPCVPCLTGTCSDYACDPSCPSGGDPYTFTITFSNLDLSPNPINSNVDFNDTSAVIDDDGGGSSSGDAGSGGFGSSYSGSGGSASGASDNTSVFVTEPLSSTLSVMYNLEAAFYFITIEAVSASGWYIRSSSNGVLIDTTPPVLISPIEQFDVAHSATQATNYQGNNHTISARWLFEDLDSGIVEYHWAIGTEPFSQDIQPFVSVGKMAQATNSILEGLLLHNTTYYITVKATNGAGLSSNASSLGITYLDIELNATLLEMVIVVEHTEALLVPAQNGTTTTVFKTMSEQRVAISWEGVGDDVSQTFWYIGSEPTNSEDIFPRTDVSFNNGRSAAIDSGVLFVDASPLSNVSDIIALTDGIDPQSVAGLLLEPGRLSYHTLEFCNLAHTCVIGQPRPSIFIRSSDAEATSDGGTVRIVVTQIEPHNMTNVPILDKNYTIVFETEGLLEDSKIFGGFLTEANVTAAYHVDFPYISNPYLTMDKTSGKIARRFTSIGGPSFFLSFLGQESLEEVVKFNITFDKSLDWTGIEPELAYWDIDYGLWREVGETCNEESVIDWTTSTISVSACSTILPGVNASTLDRPLSLSRKKRQSGPWATNMTSNFTLTNSTNLTAMELGNLTVTNLTNLTAVDLMNITSTNLTNVTVTDPANFTVASLEFLDRPVHFIVIQIGNFSINTAPELQLPSILTVEEDTPLFTYQIEYTDEENDDVWFYLLSVPTLGEANVSIDTGELRYTPCENCTGFDQLEIQIVERPIEFGIPLADTKILQIEVVNSNDAPQIFFYEQLTMNDTLVSANTTLTVYVEANRTQPVVVARLGAYDVDGYHDNLELVVTSSSDPETTGYNMLVAVVGIAESLPVTWGKSPVGNFSGYVMFLAAEVTYLPPDLDFTGSETIQVYIRETLTTVSSILTINVEVLPSLCLNNGVCGGSASDPECVDYEARIDNPKDYNCTCLPGFTGIYCEVSTDISPPEPAPDCPPEFPRVYCEGDPCTGATCPSHPSATCIPNFCGHCRAEWFMDGEKIHCTASDPSVCNKVVPALVGLVDCLPCDCPAPPYDCPEDSIWIETRTGPCCVTYHCQCPEISCPLLMECGRGVQPVPQTRGGQYPGRCCPKYNYEDIDECDDPKTNFCSHICVNNPYSHTCSCPSGMTLASDGLHCGVCTYDGLEYLLGDRVKIGCNLCICQEDSLSGQRWHCKAESCEASCQYNGVRYSISTQLDLQGNSCVCATYDQKTFWDCIFPL